MLSIYPSIYSPMGFVGPYGSPANLAILRITLLRVDMGHWLIKSGSRPAKWIKSHGPALGIGFRSCNLYPDSRCVCLCVCVCVRVCVCERERERERESEREREREQDDETPAARPQRGRSQLSCVSGFRVRGAGFRVQGTGSRVRARCGVQGAGLRVEGAGSRFRVWGAGFRVRGTGCRVRVSVQG